MLDQLTICNKKSLDDFDASISGRHIGSPAKKIVKETVPFSNKTYDFSKINGELYWEERELEYEFEITANSPEELEAKKTAFSNWVTGVTEAEIHDPHIPDYHFVGTYEDMDFDDDESVEKTVATVRFKAYPYKIANTPTVKGISAVPVIETAGTITNTSDHRLVADFHTDTSLTIEMGNTKTVFSGVEPGVSTEFKNVITLEPGNNEFLIFDVDELKEYGVKHGTADANRYTASDLLSYLKYGDAILYRGYTIDQSAGIVVGTDPYNASVFTSMSTSALVSLLNSSINLYIHNGTKSDAASLERLGSYRSTSRISTTDMNVQVIYKNAKCSVQWHDEVL